MASTALILIDFINDIVTPEGKTPSCAAFVDRHQVIQHANRALAFAREHAVPVLLVKVEFDDHQSEISPHSRLFANALAKRAYLADSIGSEFHADLQLSPDDRVLVKKRVSAFYLTNLQSFLQQHDIDTVLLAGCATSIAVQSAARDAHDRDYRVIVLADACADRDEESHAASLKTLGLIAEVINTDELVLLAR